MSQVFLSYAHEDADFVDRLHRDLVVAGVPATYDKLELEIGDSIVDKISGIIHGASCVVGIVSAVSVRSRWVQRELSWALSGELDGRTLRVLPAIIDECDLPPMLTDKLFADFRKHYFPALRALVKGIRRSLIIHQIDGREKASGPEKYDTYLGDCEQLEFDIARMNRQAVFDWLRNRPWIVASLVANPRDIVLVDPGVQGAPAPDTFVCWTPATEYLWHLVRLGPLDLAETSLEQLWAQVMDLAVYARQVDQHLLDYARRCALADNSDALEPLVQELDPTVQRSTSNTGDEERDKFYHRMPSAVPDRLILLAGRRQDHKRALLEMRRKAKTELGVEIKSCDWLLETLGGRLYRRGW